MVEKIKVPQVIGKTEEEAKGLLSQFSIQLVYEDNKTEKDGIVLRQSLQEGTIVDAGSSITIFINKRVSPEPEPEKPEEPDKPSEQPENSNTTNTAGQ